MFTKRLTWVVCLAAMWASSSVAHAFGNYRNRVPNGNVASCQTCHVKSDGGKPWNAFGEQIRKVGAPPVWADLVDLDADGDGQTNGQELGDPCGDWVMGATPPRTADISRPGDKASVSADPNAPDCVEKPTGDTGAPSLAETGDTGMDAPMAETGEANDPEDASGCGCHTGAAGFAMAPTLGLIALARRRRSLTRG